MDEIERNKYRQLCHDVERAIIRSRVGSAGWDKSHYNLNLQFKGVVRPNLHLPLKKSPPRLSRSSRRWTCSFSFERSMVI
mmetsp:Transcript_27964/g.85806  ORF Transcript_27964/g.85806 Transcript_27964/m.85806 type:complete len:80 (-) Transcript_27964:1252-1491(-)